VKTRQGASAGVGKTVVVMELIHAISVIVGHCSCSRRKHEDATGDRVGDLLLGDEAGHIARAQATPVVHKSPAMLAAMKE